MNKLQLELQDGMTDCIHMHSQRPLGSPVLDAWLDKWIMPLPGATMDSAGNVWVKVGMDSTTIFSCHTDTVCLSAKGNIELLLTSDGHLLANDAQGKATNLGADDTAGCYIMRQMVLAGVPGLYIFHDGEESGCIGSRWVNEHHNMTGYNRVVAFDRRGTTSVITHQMGLRTCSDAFASALAGQLNEHGLSYELDNGGIYTDSFHYMDQVAECTNLSVGYSGEHSGKECLNLAHARALADACLALDWEALPTSRKPGDTDTLKYGWAHDGWGHRDEPPSDETIDRQADDFFYRLEDCQSYDEVLEMVEIDCEGAAATLIAYLGLKFGGKYKNYVPPLEDYVPAWDD